MEKLIVAKQAADLHTTHFTQCILWQYMKDNDIEAHIRIIKRSLWEASKSDAGKH